MAKWCIQHNYKRAVPQKDDMAQRLKKCHHSLLTHSNQAVLHDLAQWPRHMASHQQILQDTVLYSSIKQQKKHWGTKIL